jgi:curved DNA-binding protein CbpA
MLEISPRASQVVIRAAYRALARQHHPDVNASTDAETHIRRLNAAYEILRNPENRAKYDYEVAQQQHWAKSAPPQPTVITPSRRSGSTHGSSGRSMAMHSRGAAPMSRSGGSRLAQFALGAVFAAAAGFVLLLVLWTTLELGNDAAASYVTSAEYAQR